jgi:hypothetical protein
MKMSFNRNTSRYCNFYEVWKIQTINSYSTLSVLEVVSPRAWHLFSVHAKLKRVVHHCRNAETRRKNADSTITVKF